MKRRRKRSTKEALPTSDVLETAGCLGGESPKPVKGKPVKVKKPPKDRHVVHDLDESHELRILPGNDSKYPRLCSIFQAARCVLRQRHLCCIYIHFISQLDYQIIIVFRCKDLQLGICFSI